MVSSWPWSNKKALLMVSLMEFSASSEEIQTFLPTKKKHKKLLWTIARLILKNIPSKLKKNRNSSREKKNKLKRRKNLEKRNRESKENNKHKRHKMQQKHSNQFLLPLNKIILLQLLILRQKKNKIMNLLQKVTEVELTSISGLRHLRYF